MKKPNFFIIGAPKCGTTSMAAWLGEHPQVFMSPLKEPHHFDTDHKPGFKARHQYEALFSEADETRHLRVGEASVRYLHSSIAIPSILQYSENPKFIAMVRNPVDMAPSLHEQYVFNLVEDVSDFEQAWRLQETRANGHNIPRKCVDPRHLQYGEYCKLGEQIERAARIIPEGDLKIIFLEDMSRDQNTVYSEVLDFLGLSPFTPSFEKINSAKQPKFHLISRFTHNAVRFKNRIGFAGKSFGIGNRISRWNRIERPRQKLSEALRSELSDYFKDDIEKLQDLTGRNLAHWIQ